MTSTGVKGGEMMGPRADQTCEYTSTLTWPRAKRDRTYSVNQALDSPIPILLQVTKETEYLYRAVQFARWCQDYGKHGCRTPDRPMSLFEGLAGNIYFLADLLNPAGAKFPAFVI